MSPRWSAPKDLVVPAVGDDHDRVTVPGYARHYLFLRRGVGVIGIGLPVVLVLGNAVLFGGALASSLSGYYFTGMRDVHVGGMCAVGVFLVTYRYARLDTVVGIVAGVSAIGLALLPTAPPDPSTTERLVGIAHLVFATVFFLALAFFCLFLFTRTNPAVPPTPRKLVRNRVYRVCGVLMLVCLALIVVTQLLLGGALAGLRPALWLESVAAIAFGVAWLVKGETVLTDE